MHCTRCEKDRENDFHLGASRRNEHHQGWCRKCRSDAYFEERYPTKCSLCEEHRPLWGNGICRECNEQMGLRECRTCTDLLPVLIGFYGHQRICKTCKRTRRSSGRKALAAEPGQEQQVQPAGSGRDAESQQRQQPSG